MPREGDNVKVGERRGRARRSLPIGRRQSQKWDRGGEEQEEGK
jgi:hypothetical protein